MTVQDTKNQNLNTNQSVSDNNWQMIDGKCVRICSDEQGQYFIKGGTEKVYLAEYYEQKTINAQKAKVQSDITNFFTNQIGDFKEWENYYASKIGKMSQEISLFKEAIKDNNEIVYKNTRLLNPLYEKYNTDNVKDFKGIDKKNGIIWSTAKNNANDIIKDAECRLSVRQMFIETYTRLMINAKFCGEAVQKMASQFLG